MLIQAIALGFFVVLVIVTFLHIRQNRRLLQQWQRQLDRETSRWLNDFAWSRTMQLLGALACGLIATLVLYASDIQNTNQELANNNKNMQEKMDKLLQEKITQHTSSVVTQPSAKIEVRARAVPLIINENERLEPLPETSQSISPSLDDTSTVMSNDIVNIYAPETDADDDQSTMDAIKRRYEGLLVNYLFLKKCELINPNDYHTIISTLTREMAAINAPSRLEHDILTAAQGSYSEIYAKSSCDAKETKELHTQYTNYITTISAHIPE